MNLFSLSCYFLIKFSNLALKEICFKLCKKWGCELVEVNGESDHLHLLFGFYPQMQLSKFVDSEVLVRDSYRPRRKNRRGGDSRG